MKLPEFGVKRPVSTAMLFITVLVLGYISFTKLGVDLMPDIEPTRVTVRTIWEGASAEDVENKVTRVLEKRLGSVSNLDELRSNTSEGVSSITCQFVPGTNIDEASNDVRSKVDLAERYLPDDVEKPTIFKFDSSDMPVMMVGITAKESIEKLYDIVDDEVVQPLQRLDGVGTVYAFGGLQRQITVTLSREKLAGYGLTLKDIEKAIDNENKTLPAGSLKLASIEYTIRVLGEYDTPEQVKDIPLLRKDGAIIRLKDVAEITDSFEEVTQYVQTMGRNGMMLSVQKRTGANTVDVCARVRQELEALEKIIPRDIRFYIISDNSTFITQSVDNVRSTVLWGGFFVVLVTFVFLRNIRSSIVISLTIPFSLIIAFSYMYFMEWTVNMISLSALAIAIGMVVDNAIVVLENISSQVARGVRVREASIFAASEVGLSLVASTATTICVFLPLVFVKGATGIIFRQLGGLVTATLLASMVCAMMLTPMLTSKLLKPLPRLDDPTHVGWRQRWFIATEKWFLKFEECYGHFLSWCLNHRCTVMMTGAVVVSAALIAIPFVGSEFTPDQDTGIMTVQFQLPVSTRAELTADVAKRITALVYQKESEMLKAKGVPPAPMPDGTPRSSAIRYNNWRAGQNKSGWGNRGSHSGRVNIRYLPREERPYSTQELGEAILKELRTWPELDRVFLSTSNRMMTMMMGGTNEKPIIVMVRGYDLEKSLDVANQIKQIALKTPGAVDPNITFDNGNREIVINIDRAAASALGVDVDSVVSAIRTLFYGNAASEYRQGEDEYDIFVQLGEDERRTVNDLLNSEVAIDGKRIRLDAFAKITEGLGPVTIYRVDQERVVYLQIDIYGRSLGEVFNDLKTAIDDEVNLPEGITLSYAGQIKEQGKAFADLMLMLVLGIALVYMVMAAEFESLVAPFVVMFSIPFAFAGAVFALASSGMTLNIMSFIGLIMLVGTVVNNAIVLIDFIDILRARKLPLMEAIAQAGRQRLRPVLMTTLTTIFGMIPMAISRSTGSELWCPLAVTIIGGMTLSTIVTLGFVPTFYSFCVKKS